MRRPSISTMTFTLLSLRTPAISAIATGALLFLAACTSGSDSGKTADAPKLTEETCVVASATDAPDSLGRIACTADFMALSSQPIDANLPGARSVKVVLDQADDDALYFQNSAKFQIHYEFASTHLSGNGLPIVPELASFNSTEYYSPDRRFILGAVTYYEGPQVWALEVSPYDTASADMVQKLYAKVKDAAFFGPALAFHPTSEAVEAVAAKLPSSVTIETTDQLYAKIDYQPLTLANAVGRLHFMKASELATAYVSFRDIVVLDEVPNDISVVSGIITEEFQTPLSHINVLASNRHTPNMGLRNATKNAELLALDGQWVNLTVGSSEWSIRAATSDEADAYWEAHKPAAVSLPPYDATVQGIFDIEDVTPEKTGTPLRTALVTAITVFGGKAAHYSILAKTDGVPVPKAFAVPVYYYDQFMRQNGLFDRLDALLADPTFIDDPSARDKSLADFRAAMMAAPVDQDFQDLLKAKLEKDYAGLSMRFRTSTNSEDLDGFPCAGCYESHTGDVSDWADVLDAIRETWASIWLFRTFEERTYYGVDHKSVGMALLVHHSFPDEEANGVAVTSNPFDESGLEPGFYVNVQWGGDAEVVHPPAGITSDQFLYFYDSPNQPITFLSHSNLVQDGATVLTTAQTHSLGQALAAIHDRFSPAYGPASGSKAFYAMDVEFKFDDDATPGEPAKLAVKQARPYPGRGTTE
jgi:hypothetical protein